MTIIGYIMLRKDKAAARLRLAAFPPQRQSFSKTPEGAFEKTFKKHPQPYRFIRDAVVCSVFQDHPLRARTMPIDGHLSDKMCRRLIAGAGDSATVRGACSLSYLPDNLREKLNKIQPAFETESAPDFMETAKILAVKTMFICTGRSHCSAKEMEELQKAVLAARAAALKFKIDEKFEKTNRSYKEACAKKDEETALRLKAKLEKSIPNVFIALVRALGFYQHKKPSLDFTIASIRANALLDLILKREAIIQGYFMNPVNPKNLFPQYGKKTVIQVKDDIKTRVPDFPFEPGEPLTVQEVSGRGELLVINKNNRESLISLSEIKTKKTLISPPVETPAEPKHDSTGPAYDPWDYHNPWNPHNELGGGG